jgi:uncharacterized membrane protein
MRLLAVVAGVALVLAGLARPVTMVVVMAVAGVQEVLPLPRLVE